MTSKFSIADKDSIHTLVHEMRNPLGVVKGALEMMEAFGELNDKQKNVHTLATRNVTRMENLIHDLLELVRMDSDLTLEISAYNLADLIATTVKQQTESAAIQNIKIELEIDPQIGMIMGDERQLAYVFTNLIGNAVKYNKQDGKIWVTAKLVGDEHILCQVKDTGVGIDSISSKRVFERFYRAKNSNNVSSGNGLGLAVAKQIVQDHGGDIWVESKVGEGSTFSFTIPYLMPIAAQPST